MNKLAIIAIFKNESHILKEWIEHHLNMGVDKFLLIDNGSSDNYLHIIKKYIDENKVTLKIDETKWKQNELYNKYYLHECKNYDWVMVIDLDEFVYSKNGFNKITDYLDTVKSDIDAVTMHWKLFGSSGHIKQPNNVIKNFTAMKNKISTDLGHRKNIIRGNLIKNLNQHRCIIHKKNKKMITPDNNILEYEHIANNYLNEIDYDKIISKGYLNLNHYQYQSYDFWMNVKCKRGDVLKVNVVRNESAFKSFHSKNTFIEDNELKNLTNNN
jgi:hypothetical protein